MRCPRCGGNVLVFDEATKAEGKRVEVKCLQCGRSPVVRPQPAPRAAHGQSPKLGGTKG